MNFQQLRYVRETVRQDMNLTTAAAVLFTSQPGISKQILELEAELGVDIFVRRGKRFTGLTEPGAAALKVIERLLTEAENLKRVSDEYASETRGNLTIATTHTQARYALPSVVGAFKKKFPDVHLALVQGTPPQIAEMLAKGEADIGIATETLDLHADLIAMKAYEWDHAVVVPVKHPLAGVKKLSLEELARHPIVTYDTAFTGRTRIDKAFAAAGLKPDIVFTAIDSDVIKTYVSLGMGVGIIAAMAFDAARDGAVGKKGGLVALPVGHLFGKNVTKVAVRKNAFLRGYAFSFIEAFAPALTRDAIETAIETK